MQLSNYIAHAYTPIRGPLNEFREAIGYGFFWHLTNRPSIEIVSKASYINLKCQKISKLR